MKNSVSLEIVAKEKKNLTKNQQLFNKLTKEIAGLEAKIITEDEKLVRLLELYANKIRPLISENANSVIKLAMTLGNTTERIKYTKKQKENLGGVIIELCNEAFSRIEPNEEQEAFYDQWSNVSYKEEAEAQTELEKEMLANIINSTFGIDLDIDEFDDSPQGFAKLQEKLRTEYEKNQENDNKSKKKKTKKQIQEEQNLEAKEAIKNKSIRNIYISLAKILHPDSETDPKLKSEKEEIMKKVTLAYDQKDLPTLLKLETEWVFKENQQLDKLADDKLKIYISVLQERVSELTNEIYSLYMHPKFQEISEYAHLDEEVATKQIFSQVRRQKKENKNINKDIIEFENLTDKKQIIDFIKSYQESLMDEDFFRSIIDFF